MSDRTQALHRVHRMIQALGKDEDIQTLFASDKEAVFAKFDLSDEEVAALTECTFSSLARIDVHPMYRMHWMMMSNPDAAQFLSVKEYIETAKAGASDG